MYERDLMQRYNSMLTRCYGKDVACQKYYADKGITVCDEWLLDFKNFYSWALNNGYSNELSLDRINNNGNYEPDNCRWANIFQQNNNKSNSHKVEFDGIILTVTEWARYFEIPVSEVYKKLSAGWGNDLSPCELKDKIRTEQSGNRIAEIRQRLKMTQKQFGDILGVGQSAVAQWESGENFPGTMQLFRLSELSGESITELLKDRINHQKV